MLITNDWVETEDRVWVRKYKDNYVQAQMVVCGSKGCNGHKRIHWCTTVLKPFTIEANGETDNIDLAKNRAFEVLPEIKLLIN